MLALALGLFLNLGLLLAQATPPTLDMTGIGFDVNTVFSYAKTILIACMPLILLAVGMKYGPKLVQVFKRG